MKQDRYTKHSEEVYCNGFEGGECPVLKRFEYTESCFRTIHDNMIDGIVALNKEGIILSCNRATQSVFGYSTNEMVGQSISMVIPDSKKSHLDDYIRLHAETDENDMIGESRTHQGLRKDGSHIHIRLAVNATTLNGNRLYVGIIRDISKRKQAELNLLAAKEQAEKASRAKTAFLANMSHELRTPLNAMIGFTQMLQVMPIDDAQVHDEYLDIILKSAEHLLSLINEILDLAKIESGQLELLIEALPPHALIGESIRLNEDTAMQRNITILDQTQNQDLPLLLMDEMRFKQILINLLSNAIKYNREGGEVTLSYERKPNMIRFLIEDTGKGISAEAEDQVFEKFNRLDAKFSDIEGTGIGLSLTKKLVENMGGSIGYTSTTGAGTTFWFEMPIATEQSHITATVLPLTPLENVKKKAVT